MGQEFPWWLGQEVGAQCIALKLQRGIQAIGPDTQACYE
jgi:hypothetical protein